MKTFILILSLFVFHPILASTTGFLFFGDAGTGKPAQYRVAKSMVKFCENNPCDFVSLLGDNFYPSGVSGVNDPLWKKAFETPYKDLKIPFYVALGNHDYKGDVDAQIKYSKKSKIWKMPSQYYSFTHGEIDFFVLDTNHFNKTQRIWLEDAIKKSENTWRIVVGHHPIYSYGGHGNSDELKSELLPIIEGEVDFYLAGHDHSKQVIEKKSSDITYIVSGAAGQTESLQMNRGAIYTSPSLGFAHLLITKNKAILKILDEKGDIDYTQTLFPIQR